MSQSEDLPTTLHYLADILDQLKAMSLGLKSPLLTYFIDMARMEARDEAARRTGAPSRQHRDPAA